MRLSPKQEQARLELEQLAVTLSSTARRAAEHRLPAGEVGRAAPYRLLGIVEGFAVVRRPQCLVGVRPLKVWDTWTLVDRDGRAIEGGSE